MTVMVQPSGIGGFVGYLILWAWMCSPWFRFMVLPGLMPHRGIPLWEWPWG